MGLRFLAVVLALTACGLFGCAAAGSQDTGGALTLDGQTGETSTVGDDEGSGPSVFDAGPPAQVDNGDSGESADSGSPIPDGGCTSLAQCPYQDAANVEGVTCAAGACGITCNGETYDVNGDASDGCEIVGACPVVNAKMLCPVDDHSASVAADAGSFDCTDSDSTQNFTGTIPSDSRAHQPTIDGFVAATGSTPDFFQMFGTGATLCEDDANFTLQMNAPTAQMACYTLTLITDKQTQTCMTNAMGTCSISNGSGSYEDNSQILVEVSKTPSCTAAGFPDDGTFTITGHL